MTLEIAIFLKLQQALSFLWILRLGFYCFCETDFQSRPTCWSEYLANRYVHLCIQRRKHFSTHLWHRGGFWFMFIHQTKGSEWKSNVAIFTFTRVFSSRNETEILISRSYILTNLSILIPIITALKKSRSIPLFHFHCLHFYFLHFCFLQLLHSHWPLPSAAGPDIDQPLHIDVNHFTFFNFYFCSACGRNIEFNRPDIDQPLWEEVLHSAQELCQVITPSSLNMNLKFKIL